MATLAGKQQSVRYTLRVQFGLHQNSNFVRDQLLRACDQGRIDEVMFFIFAEEQNNGHDSLERIGQWLLAVRPWKKALEQAGIEVSLNPWHTLLHGDRGRRLLPNQTWQTMTDWQGRSARAVVCPLDPDWRSYYAQTMQMYANECFRVIWIDDDLRYHNHTPLHWGGCWCDLHLAEFSRRVGCTVSRAELVAKILQPGTPHPWRGLWMDMCDDILLDALAEWRRIFEPAGTRLGLMSSSPEGHSIEGRRWRKWWQVLDQQAIPHRPHFWPYGDTDGFGLIYGISSLQQYQQIQPDGVESSPEVEHFPYGRWNKSFRQMTAQMALAQIFGAARLAISQFDFMGNALDGDDANARFLAGVKPALGWLGQVFRQGMTSVGVGIPWDPDQVRKVHHRPGDGYLHMCSRGWENWLAPMGHAFQKQPSPHINALAGTMPWAFDDATLRNWFSQGVLLDGPAAAVLVERGLGDLIGLSHCRFITQENCGYAIEESIDPEFTLPGAPGLSINSGSGPFERLLHSTLLPGASCISTLLDGARQFVGNGGCIFTNHLGGRVGIVPWSADGKPLLSRPRQQQLTALLQWVGKGAWCGSVTGGPWLIPQFFHHRDRWYVVIWNTSPDAVTHCQIHPPAGMPTMRAAVQVTAEGWLYPATVAANNVITRHPVHQWEFIVLSNVDLPWDL